MTMIWPPKALQGWTLNIHPSSKWSTKLWWKMKGLTSKQGVKWAMMNSSTNENSQHDATLSKSSIQARDEEIKEVSIPHSMANGMISCHRTILQICEVVPSHTFMPQMCRKGAKAQNYRTHVEE